MMFKKLILSLFVGTLILTSCERDNPDPESEAGFLHGAYITNEGAFGNSNGSVSYFDTDSLYMVNHVFESVNGRPLGDVVQSVAIAGNKAFIVVNNSQKVEVVDLKTFESVGVIEGLEYPRYFLPVSDKKGYLTDGNFVGRVYVVDIEMIKITDTIPCGSGPEKMILYQNKLLVANSGGWGNDSTLTVIDTGNDQVMASWWVGMNPVDMVLDKEQQLWVLCKGKVVWNMDYTIGEETTSTLTSVNPATGGVTKTIHIGTVGDYFWPQRMAINKALNKICYLESEGIILKDIGNSSAGQPLITKNFYGFGIDPVTDLIYGLSAPSFTTSGWMFRYLPDGTVKDSLEVGIGPSQIVFN